MPGSKEKEEYLRICRESVKCEWLLCITDNPGDSENEKTEPIGRVHKDHGKEIYWQRWQGNSPCHLIYLVVISVNSNIFLKLFQLNKKEICSIMHTIKQMIADITSTLTLVSKYSSTVTIDHFHSTQKADFLWNLPSMRIHFTWMIDPKNWQKCVLDFGTSLHSWVVST